MEIIIFFGGLVLIGVLCALGIMFLSTCEERKIKLINKHYPKFITDMQTYTNLWLEWTKQADKVDNILKQRKQLEKELSYTCPCTKFYVYRDTELNRLINEVKKESEILAQLYSVLRQSKQNLIEKYFFIDFDAEGNYEIVGSKREIKKGIKFCFKYKESGM